MVLWPLIYALCFSYVVNDLPEQLRENNLLKTMDILKIPFLSSPCLIHIWPPSFCHLVCM